MPTRLTIFFRTAEYSWTESHYSQAQESITQQLLDDSLTLIKLRAACLAPAATIFDARVSDTAKPLQVDYVDFGPAPLPFYATGIPEEPNADRPYSAIMIFSKGSSGAIGRLYTSGIPDAVIVEGQDSRRGMSINLTPPFQKVFQKYWNELVSKWAFRAYDNTVLQNVLGPPTVAGPGTLSGVNLPALVTFVNGLYKMRFVRMKKFNTRAKGWNGVWQVDRQVAGFPPGGAPFNYYLFGSDPSQWANIESYGQAGPVVYTYPKYNTYRLRRATHRKRGASAGAPRGRSRTRV